MNATTYNVQSALDWSGLLDTIADKTEDTFEAEAHAKSAELIRWLIITYVPAKELS